MNVSVYVRYSRTRHIAANNGRTLCGKRFHGRIVGPPASDKPLCESCQANQEAI